MSAIPQPASTRFVSERILEPLRQVARRQWTVLATKGVIQTLLFSLGLILAAVLILGRFDNIPVWVRVPVAVHRLGLGDRFGDSLPPARAASPQPGAHGPGR